MADSADATEPGAAPPIPPAGDQSQSPADAHAAGADAFADRPEVYVGAAFAGGLVLAGLLRVLGR